MISSVLWDHHSTPSKKICRWHSSGSGGSETRGQIWPEEQDTPMDARCRNRIQGEEHGGHNHGPLLSDSQQPGSCLKFTRDSPEKNHIKKFPVLDTQMWLGVEGRTLGIPRELLEGEELGCKVGSLHKVILYTFYKKPMASRMPTLGRSAMPEGGSESHSLQWISEKIQECVQRPARRRDN